MPMPMPMPMPSASPALADWTKAANPAALLCFIAKHSKARLSARGVLTVLSGYVRWSEPQACLCEVTQTEIALNLGASRSTVQAAIGQLIELGEITVERAGGGRTVTLYRLSGFERWIAEGRLGRGRKS